MAGINPYTWQGRQPNSYQVNGEPNPTSGDVMIIGQEEKTYENPSHDSTSSKSIRCVIPCFYCLDPCNNQSAYIESKRHGGDDDLFDYPSKGAHIRRRICIGREGR
jgi:hypothetical protein